MTTNTEAASTEAANAELRALVAAVRDGAFTLVHLGAAAVLGGSAAWVHFSELGLPAGIFTALGTGRIDAEVLAVLVPPALLLGAALVLLVRGLSRPGLGGVLRTLGPAGLSLPWATAVGAVVALLAAPVTYLSIVLQSIAGPLTRVEVALAVGAPLALVALSVALVLRTVHLVRGRRIGCAHPA